MRLKFIYVFIIFKNPIKSEILKAVAEHVVSGDKSDVLLLDSVSLDDTTNPFEIPVPREATLQRYLPAWLTLKRLRRLAVLVQHLHDNHDQQTTAVESTAIASP